MHQTVCNKCGTVIEENKGNTGSLTLPQKSEKDKAVYLYFDLCGTYVDEFRKSLKHSPK